MRDNAKSITELYQSLRPLILRDVSPSTSALSGGGGVMETHALNGPFHTGTLIEAQAPWAATKNDIQALTENGLLHDRVHVLASTSGLGSDHTVAGLTAGQYLRASGATSASFAAILDADIPATIVRTSLTLTAGDGLTGLGDLSANRTVAVALSGVSGLELVGTSPDKTLQLSDSVAGDGLTVASKVFAVGVANTIQAGAGAGLSVEANAVRLTAGYDPGSASSILASDATGKLTLPLMVASTSLTTPLILAGAGQSLTLQPPVDLILDPASNRTKMAAGVSIEASAYASQTTGWRVTDAGEADFRYLYVDEMHAKSFIADLEQALAGGQIIAKSVAQLYSNFTAPAAGATAQLVVRDLPSATGMAVFVNGDYIRIRIFSRSGGSLTIGDCWGTVALDTSYGTSGFDSTTKTQRYTFTRSSGADAGAMTAGTVVYADAIILDYGTAGNGIYEVNAIDGLYGLNSPYAQVATWASHPRSMSVKGRFGNLRGIFSVADEYGLYAGSGTAVTDRYIRASNTALELRNVPLAMYDGTSNTMLLSAGASNNSPFMALGSTLPTGPLTNSGIWLGKDGAAYKWRVGTVSGGALVKGIYWDGADLIWKATNTSLDASGNLNATSATLSGTVTANAGAIGGWTIAASGLTATNIGLYSGAANTARVQVGSGSDAAGINATAAAGDIAFWAGDTHANRASADFRVTAAGAMYATTGTIAGDFTVSGGGKLTASGGGIVMTATGINVGLYPNIDGGAAPGDESKALAWYSTPATATGLQARQYVALDGTSTPHWNVTVGPAGTSPLTMTLWAGPTTTRQLLFANLTMISGMPALFLAKGTPDTAQISSGARLQLNAGSTFLASAHLKAGTTNTYDIGEAGVKWRTLYVGNVVADTISGTSLSGATWRNNASDMGIYSNYSGTRILTIANDGVGVMNVEIDGSLKIVTGNITLEGSGATVDGVDISAHAANVNAHHAQSHVLAGSDHTASGLTAGWVLRASTATTFAWAQLAHSDLSGVGTNTHAQIDSHISATAAHGATGAVVGTTNTQTLSGKTLTTPTIGDFTNATHAHTGAASGGTIAHTSLTSIGTNTHAQIDTHISATAAHGATGAVVGTTNTQTLSGKTLTTPTIGDFTNATHAHTGAASGGTIAHTSLTSIGTNTHAQIDSHISATTAHGATGAVVGTTNTQTLTNKTLTTPTIGDFTNAGHAHTNAASGGTIAHSSLTGRTANDHHNQSHVLATNLALGGDHTISGATAGHVLRASGATTALFAAIADADLPSTIVRTSRTLTAGAGLTGTSTLASDVTFAVGAGLGITVNADDVALASSVAGAGLTYTTGVLAVGAGTLITVAADSVGLSVGTAQYQIPVTGATTFTPAYTLLSTFAGAGLTFTSGTFAIGAGLGITVNADDVALTTPGTLTAATTNSSTGSHTHAITANVAASTLTVASTGTVGTNAALARADHTHAITSSSNPGAAAAILATSAAGALTLVDMTVTALTASRLVASDGSDKLVSVSALSSWIAGTSNRVTVADDGDGTITLSAPQDIHTAATPTFGGLIAPWLRPATDSTTALQLRNQSGTSIFNVDTTNSRIGVNKTNPTYSLDVSGAGRFTSTLYADDDLSVFDALTVGGAASVTGNLTVGTYNGGVLQVSAAGYRVGINRAADSQFDLDVAGAIRGQYLVGPHALQLSDAKAIVHFDGPAPYNLNFSGTSTTHMGKLATETDDIIYRPGMFSKAIQLAEATTNLHTNPSFDSTTAGFSYRNSGVGTVVSTDSVYGLTCLSFATGATSTPYVYATHSTGLATGQSYTFSIYIKAGTAGAVGKTVAMFLRENENDSYRTITYYTVTSSWQRITVSRTLTHATPTSLNYYCYFYSTGGDGTVLLIDAVQLEAKAYATPYHDGSLTTPASWSGTAHASTSSRTSSSIAYSDIGIANGSPWTIAGWFQTSVRSGVGNNYLFGLASSDDKVLRIYVNENTISAYDNESGNRYRTLLSATETFAWDTWTFIAVTSDGTNITAFCNAKSGTPVALSLGVASVVLRPTNSDYYDATFLADELVILDYAADAKLIRSIYESNAPVFAESSVVSFRAPSKSAIWVDEFGMWAKGKSGGEAFAIYGGNPRWKTGDPADTKSWGGLTLEENDVAIGRTTSGGAAVHWDDSANTLRIGVQTAEHLALTSTSLLFMNSTTEMAKLDGTTFTLGSTAGSHVAITSTTIDLKYGGTSKISLDASGNASFTGAITAASGTVGGWTIGATLSATNLVLTPGAANVAHILAGTGSTAGGINAAAAAGDIVFWAGENFANRAGAEFRVTAGGSMTATSGTIGGWTIGAALTATNISLTPGAVNVARIEVGDGGSNQAGINSTGASTDWSFWSGATHANRATASYRVRADGYLYASNATITGAITANSGSIAGALTIGSSGGIYQGSGTFASPTTGLKIWNDGGTYGRIGGYNAGTLQWYAGSDGKLYAGGGNVLLDQSGIAVAAPTNFAETNGYAFLYSGNKISGVFGSRSASMTEVALISNYGGGQTNHSPQASIRSILNSSGDNYSHVLLQSENSYDGALAQLQVSVSGPTAYTKPGKGWITAIADDIQLTADGIGIEGALRMHELTSTPSTPTSGTRANIYMKGDRLIIQYNDGGTVRYKYLGLTGTGVTWVHDTVEP